MPCAIRRRSRLNRHTRHSRRNTYVCERTYVVRAYVLMHARMYVRMPDKTVWGPLCLRNASDPVLSLCLAQFAKGQPQAARSALLAMAPKPQWVTNLKPVPRRRCRKVFKRLRLSLLQNKMLRQRLNSARHQLRNIKNCAADTLHQDYEKGLYNETVVQQIEDEDTDASSDVVFGC